MIHQRCFIKCFNKATLYGIDYGKTMVILVLSGRLMYNISRYCYNSNNTDLSTSCCGKTISDITLIYYVPLLSFKVKKRSSSLFL